MLLLNTASTYTDTTHINVLRQEVTPHKLSCWVMVLHPTPHKIHVGHFGRGVLLVTAAVEYRTCQENDEVTDVWVLRKAGLFCAENWMSVSLVRKSIGGGARDVDAARRPPVDDFDGGGSGGGRVLITTGAAAATAMLSRNQRQDWNVFLSSSDVRFHEILSAWKFQWNIAWKFHENFKKNSIRRISHKRHKLKYVNCLLSIMCLCQYSFDDFLLTVHINCDWQCLCK